MIYNKLYSLLIVVAVLALGAKAYTYHQDRIEEARASVIQEYDRQYVQDLETQLASSKELLEASLTTNKELNEDKASINLRNVELVNSLRNRPVRIETKQGVSDSTSTPCPNTGSSLSREDSEFLAGEAASAEMIVKERDYYYGMYQKLKNELDKLNGKD